MSHRYLYDHVFTGARRVGAAGTRLFGPAMETETVWKTTHGRRTSTTRARQEPTGAAVFSFFRMLGFFVVATALFALGSVLWSHRARRGGHRHAFTPRGSSLVGNVCSVAL